MNASRWKDLGAMLLIGDGMMGMIQPRRYTSEWNMGPRGWRNLMEFLNERPSLTRALGAMEVACGLALAASKSKKRRCWLS